MLFFCCTFLNWWWQKVLQWIFDCFCIHKSLSEVCAGLRFVSSSRPRVGFSALLLAQLTAWRLVRLPADFQQLVPAWSQGKNFLSSAGPGPGALLSSPGLSIGAGNPGDPDMEQY